MKTALLSGYALILTGALLQCSGSEALPTVRSQLVPSPIPSAPLARVHRADANAAATAWIAPTDAQFGSMARQYHQHQGPVQWRDQIYLADDNGIELLGFTLLGPAPEADPSGEVQIRQRWQQFHATQQWGDWSSHNWPDTAWFGPLGSELDPQWICRQRRCLAELDFAHNEARQRLLTQRRLPAHMRLQIIDSFNHSLLILTRY
ncbi:hypothetical protein [Ferrimonas pelagia]|uniref:Lipoprotein n=1 Tax=Ferrimonas pelagia TaxID=1177826 RepID=A0ABP9F9C5_9GAMM